jgi:hypothetical protein
MRRSDLNPVILPIRIDTVLDTSLGGRPGARTRTKSEAQNRSESIQQKETHIPPCTLLEQSRSRKREFVRKVDGILLFGRRWTASAGLPFSGKSPLGHFFISGMH